MSPTAYIPLADFAQTWTERASEVPFAVEPRGAAPRLPAAVARRVDEVVDTVVALQRAEWLEEGAYLGPSSMPVIYRIVLDGARALGVVVPVAIVASVPLNAQGVHGTDDRPFLLLSSHFISTATPSEVAFVVGQQLGHIAAGQVTARSLYALIVDHNGVRRLARRAVGPTLDVVLAPVSLGLRLALSRWHRLSEVTGDRAGLLVSDDLAASQRAMLRCALGSISELDVGEYLKQNRASKERGPGRWAEILTDRPWLHKRLKAVDLWARSEPFVTLGGSPVQGDLLDADTLSRRTLALLAVGT
ncbi:MAG: M48 family peptidase [Deltaproteobacteria bacterium]|nr:MAG: M48 family peptidase [Deltaproteobacteria bacterium]